MPATRRRGSAPAVSPSSDHNPLLHVVGSAFTALSPREQNALAHFLNAWAATKAERRALLLKLLLPDLPDEVVAQVAGVARTTLYNWPSYKRLKVILAQVPDLPRGAVDGDGFVVEAWHEDAG